MRLSQSSLEKESALLNANASTDSRTAARRLRRQYPQQPIAQLDHHYHHQYQRPPPSQQQTHHNTHNLSGGPPCLVPSRSLASSMPSTSRRLPSKMKLRRSDVSGTTTASSRSRKAMGAPVFCRSRTEVVGANGIVAEPSPSSRGQKFYYDDDYGSGGMERTPYEHWRRLRRARTTSGNSCASTSSTSSFASYVVNPKTGQFDCELESDVQSNEEEAENRSSIRNLNKDKPKEPPFVLERIVAPVLPPPPYPVDSYHFYSKSNRTNTGAGTAAAEVTSTLAALFTGCGIEAIFHPLKCKFKCLKYVHYSHVEFVVRVYAHQRALLVEFQRRSGSMLLWDGLYRILYQKLVPIIDATALPCSQSSGQKRIANDIAASPGFTQALNLQTRQSCSLDHEGLCNQLWQTLSLKKPTPSSGVEAMKIMLTSRYLDAMREGCAGLAELTEDVENSCLVAHASMVTPLIQAAGATDLSMSRCAIGALANIARAVPRFPESELLLARQTALQLRSEATPVILRQLEDANEHSLFSIELFRECARALGAFVRLVSEVDPRAVAASSINDERCLRVFCLHAKHRDAQLASYCRAALEQLRLILK